MFELTPYQQEIINTYEIYSENHINNLVAIVHLKDNVNFDRLAEAVLTVGREERELRIRVTKSDFSYFQSISEEDVKIEILDELDDEKLQTYLHEVEFQIDSSLCKFVFVPHSHLLGIEINHVISDANGVIGLINKIFSKYAHEEQVKSETEDKLYFLDEYDKYRHSVRYDNDEKFWKNECAENRNCKSLKIDVPQYQSKRSVFLLDRKFSEQFMAVCSELNMSPAVVITAAVLLYLHKVTAAPVVSVGAPFLLKSKKNSEKLGMMVNIVPVSFDFSDDLSFGGYLEALKKKWFSYLKHSKFPSKAINNAFRTENGTTFPISAIVSYQTSSFTDEVLTYTTRNEWSPAGEIAFPLEIHFSQRSNQEGLFEIDYKSSMFLKEEIKGIYDFMTRFIKTVIENKNQLKSVNLASLKVSESYQEPSENKQFAYMQYSNISEALSPVFQKYQKKNAILTADKAMSYEALEERAEKVYAYLLKQKVKSGSIVGVYMMKSADVISTALGILKAACVYLPLDPTYPQKRNQYILSDARPSLIFTDADDYELDNFVNVNTIVQSNFQSALSFASEKDRPQASLKDTAYIIYTSGTTGKPKGVQISHENLLSLIVDSITAFDFSDNDVWMFFHSHTFDFSIWEIFGSLITGASLYIPQKFEILDVSAFADMIAKNRITVMNITPLAFYNLVSENKYLVKHQIRYIIFGGDTLNFPKLRAWHAKHSQVKLVNMYGITEITVHATYKEISEQDLDEGFSNIGKAIKSLNIYVLNENLEEVGIGNIGEIYVAGKGVSKGYLRKAELTNEKFVHIPYEKEKVYKSGDLVRLLGNGDCEYIGRSDKLVNVKGYRVELGEIETTLSHIPSIKSVAVIPYETSESMNMELACFITTDKSELSVKELRDFLAQRLPFYMIPNQFISINEIPITENGKVDGKSLTRYLKNSIDRRKNVKSDPSEDRASVINDVWKTILNLDESGESESDEDNFYALGGDSIKAIQLISILKEKGIKVSMENFLQNPTKQYFLSTLDENDRLSKVYAKKVGLSPYAPMHHYAFRNGLTNHYLQALVVKSKVNLSKKELISILETMSETHDVLRINEINDNDKSLYYSDDKLNITVTELSQEFTAESIESAINTAFENSCKLIDIEKGIFGVLSILHTNDATYLLFSLHHSIIDGYSWRVFLEDFECLILNPHQPLRKTMTFDDWTRQQFEGCQTNELREPSADKIWSNFTTLGDSSYTEFEVNLSALHEFIAHFKGSQQYSLENLFLTAFLLALSSSLSSSPLKQNEIIVEKEIHGRDTEVGRTLGWFTQIYKSRFSSEDMSSNLYEALDSVYKTVEASKKEAAAEFINEFVRVKSDGKREFTSLRYNYLGELRPFVSNKMALHKVFFEGLAAKNYEFSTDYELNILQQGEAIKVGFRYLKENSEIIPGLIKEFKRKIGQIADLDHFLNNSIDTGMIDISNDDLLYLLNDLSLDKS